MTTAIPAAAEALTGLGGTASVPGISELFGLGGGAAAGDAASSAAPGLLSRLAGGTSKAAKMVGPAIAPTAQNAANNVTGEGNFSQSTNNADAILPSPDTAAAGTQAALALPAATVSANQGIADAAQIEKNIASPVGLKVKDTGAAVMKNAAGMQQDARAYFDSRVQDVSQAAIDTEKALQAQSAAAQIDPQAYLHSMGVGGKMMTAIGMVLGGAAGGQNQAIDLYKQNVDNAIKAQTQTFKNLMETSAQRAGLIKTAQDGSRIAADAYNMAVMSVATGANTAIQGALTQIGGDAAPALAKGPMLYNQSLLSQAMDRHSSDFRTGVQSGDVGRLNLTGNGLDSIYNYFTGNHLAAGAPSQGGRSPADRIGRPIAPVAGQSPAAQPISSAIPAPPPAVAPSQPAASPTLPPGTKQLGRWY